MTFCSLPENEASSFFGIAAKFLIERLKKGHNIFGNGFYKNLAPVILGKSPFNKLFLFEPIYQSGNCACGEPR